MLDAHQIHLKVSAKVMRRLRSLMRKTNQPLERVFSRALAIYEELVEEDEKGSAVLIDRADGSNYELKVKW